MISPVFFFERLPRLYLAALVAAWLLGAIDVVALVADTGGGTGGAMAVLVGPVALLGPLRARQAMVSPEWRPWALSLVFTGLASSSLAALIYTRIAFGAWLHPGWLG